ncbi:MAG: hypothetical protein IPG06_02435 [Haliea sp.]|nr:hypothetical protein [Haliea sp.]
MFSFTYRRRRWSTSAANWSAWLYGAKHHRRSTVQHAPPTEEAESSGAAIAVGALIDGVPESIAVSPSLLAGPGSSLVTVAAILSPTSPGASQLPAGMKRSGRSAAFIFSTWGRSH